MTTPPLQLDIAQDITTAIGRDLLSQDIDVPDLRALTAAAETTPGRLWIGQLAGELEHLSWTRFQPITARRVLTSLCDDFRRRQVPVDHMEARINFELEDAAQELPPAEWLGRAGDAWEDVLAIDAQVDAADV